MLEIFGLAPTASQNVLEDKPGLQYRDWMVQIEFSCNFKMQSYFRHMP